MAAGARKFTHRNLHPSSAAANSSRKVQEPVRVFGQAPGARDRETLRGLAPRCATPHLPERGPGVLYSRFCDGAPGLTSRRHGRAGRRALLEGTCRPRGLAPQERARGDFMPKSMLVNVTAEEENRVAIVDNAILDVFEIETLSKEHLKGNIFKVIVEGINPALEAAFVNYGGERAGFLPLDEINFKLYHSRDGGSGAKGRGARITRHLDKGQEVLV